MSTKTSLRASRRWLCLAVIHLTTLSGFGTSLSFIGTGSYSISGNSVVLQADRIENNEFAGISGTILLELWAFSVPYPGVTVGYKLASYALGQLPGGYYFYNVNSGLIPFSLPPPGTWSLSLQAREYVGLGGDGYTTRAWINFSSPVRVAGGAYVGDIDIIGLTTWQISGSVVELTVEKISNICDLGISGSLRLDLWATASQYGGGTIVGYRFASVALNPLTAGYAYNFVDQIVPFVRPPDGNYYVTLTLSEYHNGSYLIVDYLNYSSRLVVGNVLSAPVANPATSLTRNSFTANWGPVSGALGYLLDVSTTSTFSSYVDGYSGLNVGQTTSRIVNDLIPGATYYYRVRAYNGNGASGNSGAITVTLPCTYTISVSSSGGGTVGGGGTKNCGATVTVTAMPNTGYRFVDWTEGGSQASTSANYVFSANADRSLIANFVDSQGPLVSITNPAAATTYTSSQSITIGATASDVSGVTTVEFYDGAIYRGSDSVAPYTYDWIFAAPDNGPHAWTARAYDTLGNASTSSPVTLTVSVDITPPAVAIVSPTNGASRTTKTNVVSGTASDSGTVRSGLSLVQVRVNGGPWQTATGTTNWNRSVIWEPCGNLIEARSLDKAGNYSATASVAVVYVPPNTIPNRPTNVWPATGTSGMSLTPTLQASAFVDSDCIGDTHTASQWQVWNSSGTISIVGSGTNTVNLTSWTVPPNKLSYGSNYQWRVRYRDSRNGWSSNSVMTSFATAGPHLSLAKQGTNMVFRWPTNTPGFGLQWRTNLTAGNWSNATPLAVVAAGQYTVTNRVTGERRFYRLKR